MSIYLTPASISFLNQSLLALLITIYLIRRLFYLRIHPPSHQDKVLFLVFIITLSFSLLLFLDASLLPTERLYAVYLENTVVGILLLFLIEFAYSLLSPRQNHKTERRIALLLCGAYIAYEAGIAIWRFNLLRLGKVEFRPDYADILPAVGFLWVVFLFMRGAVQNWRLPAARQFALVFILPFCLAIINLLRTFYRVSTPFYNISMSVGILFTLLLFVMTYLTSQPEKTSFAIKFSGAILTAMLAVFGIVAWLVTPAYASQYTVHILDHRTIRFTPNEQGGYDVAEIPFHFEENLGENLQLTDSDKHSSQEIEFDFPFFGQNYQRIFVWNDSFVAIGENLSYRDLQYQLGNVPLIFPLMVDLFPEKSIDGGVFLKQETERLIITWKDLPAFYHPEFTYTSQLTLYTDGSFEITYNGLPEKPVFFADDRPEATLWAIGAKPALMLQGQASVDFTQLPTHGGTKGLIQDEYRSFRMYLHTFLFPIAIAILTSSILLIVGSIALFQYSLAHPLNSLLKAVQALNDGQRGVNIPVQFNDEIGFLTQSFNNLSSELNGLITDLENRVAARTSELSESETRYRQLFDLESDAIFIIRNSDGQILEANEAASQLYGFGHEEIVRKRNADLSAEPEVTQKETDTLSPSDSTIRIPLRWHRKMDGTPFPVGITARFVTWKGEAAHIAAIRDITEQHEIEQELVRLAITDELTSLPNRRHFVQQAEQVFARSNQPPYALSLMMLDVDYFKTVNDQFGHAVGDVVLSETAHIMDENLRPTDLLARIGGEEFAILLPRTLRLEAQQIGDRLCRVLASTPIQAEGHAIHVAVSIGIAILDETVGSLDELLSRADQALYDAKERGRNRCETWYVK
jgi:diguanylate cyclase (GGDEF)-like protein/PAS domain S-box-containing protein